MITLSDCEAFCDADPGWVHELARREGLALAQAYAHAHQSMTGAPDPGKATCPAPSAAPTANHRLAA